MAEEKVVIPPYKPPYDAEYIRRILTEYVDDLLYGSCCDFHVEYVNETKELFEFDVVLDPLAGRLAGVYMRKLCDFFGKHYPATELDYIQPEGGRLKLRVRVERSEITESIVLKGYGLNHF